MSPTYNDETNPLLNGEYKTILSLTSVLQNGKIAKRLADRAIDQMQGVQNLRQAIYPYKVRSLLSSHPFYTSSILPLTCLITSKPFSQLKAESSEGSKAAMLHHLGTNYLYRYGKLTPDSTIDYTELLPSIVASVFSNLDG